jgi:glutamate synthase (NADPH/NADH) small chain
MGKPTGFIEFGRVKQPYRPVGERIRDWKQVMEPWPVDVLYKQASRCMDCGIPFCHNGCPLGNLIPDWNDLVYREQWRKAIDRLHATNNFPEFTGTLCPAPCEGSCVLGINDNPVTIKAIELAIVDKAWESGWIIPLPPDKKSGKKVAIVGSGPAGLAAAQQLARAGHDVTVFERDDLIGGLMRYGIPEFKMEKHRLDRRIEQMQAEGVEFHTNSHIGQNVPVTDLTGNFDALLLAGGACAPRDLPVPGRELNGVHFAMEYLSQSNHNCQGDEIAAEKRIDAAHKHVVIIGGGDTGADCLGTAHRQRAALITQLEIMPRPPEQRSLENPWPEWPNIYRVASAHEEGGKRLYAVSTTRFIGDEKGNLRELELVRVEAVHNYGRITFNEIPKSHYKIPCELALLAMGFTGPERPGMLEQLGVKFTDRNNVWHDGEWKTSVEGVFTAGDMQHGQSLIVWAIAEGRSAARAIDKYLMGTSELPALL